MTITAGDIDARIRAVERLAQIFKTERTIYLGMTMTSVVILLGCAGFLIAKTGASIQVLVGLFGSSGIITYSMGRVLRMWDQALAAMTASKGEG